MLLPIMGSLHHFANFTILKEWYDEGFKAGFEMANKLTNPN
jgi:hypothetical protein